MPVIRGQAFREATRPIEPERYAKISKLLCPGFRIHGDGFTDTICCLDPVPLDRSDNPFCGLVTTKKSIDASRCETRKCKARHRV